MRDIWCTSENIQAMYNNCYQGFVKSGIAEELLDPIMYDENGEIILDPTKMVVIPTKLDLRFHQTYCL